MILKLSSRLVGDMVIQVFLIGPSADGLRQAGTLRLRPVEWQMLNVLIGMGADRMDGDITVVLDAPPDIAAAATE